MAHVAGLGSDAPVPWNHNIHYHGRLAAELPGPAARVLDVGCGDGTLARRLAPRAASVVGIDPHGPSIASARQLSAGVDNVEFIEASLFDDVLERGSFDFVTAVASLHHMDHEAGLVRMADLLRPGGVLAVVGIARTRSARDLAFDGAGFVTTRVLGARHGGNWQHAAPIREPDISYGGVRRVARRVLPGCHYRRLVLFRYLLTWRKPQ